MTDVVDEHLKCRIKGRLDPQLSKESLRGLVEEATADLHKTLGNCCKLEIFTTVNDEENCDASSEGISVTTIFEELNL